jgi:hypothetical protein
MRFDGWKLGCIEVWWLGGIYSPNHQNDRWWGLLSYGAPDSPVRQPRHQAVGFRPLELLTSGPPDSLVCLLVPALTSARAVALFTVHCSVADDHWRLEPLLRLAHRTVWWIIGERPPRIPEGGKFGVELPGAPDYPVRRPGLPLGCLLLFLFEPVRKMDPGPFG